MAFSGTISETVFDTRRVIDRAFGRCRLKPQQITSDYIDVAMDQLYLLLSTLGTPTLPLWCIEKQVYPLYNGVNEVTLDLGTIDVLSAFVRTSQGVGGSTVDTATSRTYDYGSATAVSTVGIKWSAASVPLALERSDDNVNWTTVQTEAPTATAGAWTWFDLSSVVASRYFRVRATSGTLAFSDMHTGGAPTEITLARLNRDQYTSLPNKNSPGARPLQYWLDRQVRRPIMRIWPQPTAASEHTTIVVWRHRHIMDVGSMTQEIEVPQRWIDAIVAGLAARLALEIAEVDANLISVLDASATQALYLAQAGEHDNSPVNWAPNISAYNR